MNNLQSLLAEKDNMDAIARQDLEAVERESKLIQDFDTMKSTDGWKTLEAKLKEQLSIAILNKVKDDPEIRVLMSLFETVETKNQRVRLEEVINHLIQK